jgi:hypothetical protein
MTAIIAIPVSGWKRGKGHAPRNMTYGVRMSPEDRDAYFDPAWTTVSVAIGELSTTVIVELRPSFWKQCPELRSSTIRDWLWTQGLTPWRDQDPPSLILES